MESTSEYLITRYCCPANSCGKSYKNKFSLKNHYTVAHLHVKRFICSLCGRDFVSNQNLIDHMNIHTGSKPYKCRICKKEFRQASLLSLHKKTHDKNYESTLVFTLTYIEANEANK